MKERVGVALSGGADSALTASLLLSRGHSVFGLHLLLAHTSAAEAQAARAGDIAHQLGMEFRVIDAADVFAASVIAPFCQEYSAGRTPNPCVTCNRDIKFGLLLRTALESGADKLATGHYARVVPHERRYVLRRAVDHQADQSYFLYAIDAAALEHLVLPLGEVLRSEVRSQALQQGLIRGKSSQDICFLVGQDLRSFLAERVDATPGDIVDLEGHVRGRHDGLPFYTVGQRHGLGIALGTPAYVVRLDARRNRVVLGTADALLSASARLRHMRWLVQPEGDVFPAQARIRYRARCTSAQVTLKVSEALVRFLEPQRAVAPGQSVVFYDGDTVLGGGVVAETFARVHDAD